MFDGEIDEPGGVDCQGTAVFTECEFFHLPTGDYVEANPPVNEAAARELFFDLIHEMGHAFNLAHSFQKHASSGTAWPAPSWMPTVQDPQAMSWMNYPDLATESGSPSSPTLSATWFYNRFRFRFDRNELLFLRHAPDRFVQMGNEAWFTNHGRISHSEVDPSLGFEIRTRKPVFQLGEAMEIELKLWNKGPRAIEVPGHFDLLDGLLEIGITLPDGRKWPVLPFSHARHHVAPRMLEPGEALYEPIDLTIGKLGLPFKHPGAYRLEASVRYGYRAAAAVCRIFVEATDASTLPAVAEIFDARMGRVLTMHGTRVMGEELQKIDWVLSKIAADHPAAFALRRARAGAFATRFKVLDPSARTLSVEDSDPGFVFTTLGKVVAEPNAAANSLGHIGYEQMVQTYTECAVDAGKKGAARTAQKEMVDLFKKRKVVDRAVKRAESRLKQLT